MTDRTFKQCIGRIKADCSAPACMNKTTVSFQHGPMQCDFCGFNMPVCLTHCTIKCTCGTNYVTYACYKCFPTHMQWNNIVEDID